MSRRRLSKICRKRGGEGGTGTYASEPSIDLLLVSLRRLFILFFFWPPQNKNKNLFSLNWDFEHFLFRFSPLFFVPQEFSAGNAGTFALIFFGPRKKNKNLFPLNWDYEHFRFSFFAPVCFCAPLSPKKILPETRGNATARIVNHEGTYTLAQQAMWLSFLFSALSTFRLCTRVLRVQ